MYYVQNTNDIGVYTYCTTSTAACTETRRI